MNIQDLETRLSELNLLLEEPLSDRKKLFSIADFYDIVLNLNNQSFVEVYISALISSYISHSKSLKIRGLNPERVNILILQVQTLLEYDFTHPVEDELHITLNYLKEKKKQLDDWLQNKTDNNSSSLIYFPVLESFKNDDVSGFLEIISIDIKKGEQQFLINSISYDSDSHLKEQLEIAWNNAMRYCTRYVRRTLDQHTIDIRFQNNLGTYTGSSFGIALFIAFVETILKFYNSPTLVRINGIVAITGAIDKSSNIVSAGKSIIETKTETVFFSDASILCVPKIDEMWADEKLKQLKVLYPERNLRIIGITDLDDLLSRRNVVDIHKKNIFERFISYLIRKWKSILLAAVLTILFSFVYVMDFDTNPDSYYTEGPRVNIVNKNGKVIWSTRHGMFKQVNNNPGALKYLIKLFDVDGDGKKEIIYARPEEQQLDGQTNTSQLIVIKNLKDTIWTYNFSDSVSSEREDLSRIYTSQLIDIALIDEKLTVICWAQNTTSFANAVYLLDAKTGERINKTHWCAGHITNGLLQDVNKDGKQDLVLTGIDNGYEDAVLWAIELDKIDGYRITIPSYVIKDKKKSDLLFYFRIPKTDYERYMGFRSPTIGTGSLSHLRNNNLIRFVTMSYSDRVMSAELPLLEYQLNPNLKDFNIFISSLFRVKRDTLVAQGYLNEPYTDTKEYIEIQRDNILYWKDSVWVSRKDLDK